MADAQPSVVAPPQLRFPPPDVSGAALTANGLLSSQQSPAALEVAEAAKANQQAADLARKTQLLREAVIEQDRTKVVLPAMNAWRQSRPVSRRVDYPATLGGLGAVGLAGFSVVRGSPRPVSTVLSDAAGYALLGGALGYGLGLVVRDVVDVSRPPVPLPLEMPTEVRAALVAQHKPDRWRLEGWLVSWRELAVELNGYSAPGNGAAAGLGEVASLMRLMRG